MSDQNPFGGVGNAYTTTVQYGGQNGGATSKRAWKVLSAGQTVTQASPNPSHVRVSGNHAL